MIKKCLFSSGLRCIALSLAGVCFCDVQAYTMYVYICVSLIVRGISMMFVWYVLISISWECKGVIDVRTTN